MYEQFYGLKERPFSLNPNPFYLYMSNKHKKALSLMEYGLINQAAFSVITGEIGTGKTTLVRQLLHQIDKKFSIGLLTSTHHSFGELLKLILIAFNLDHRNKDKAELYQALYDFLIEEYSRHHQVVLIIDEAQNMAPDTLEELRMLSNINVEEHNVLQMILVGQEGLRKMLRRPDLEQFAQRIAVDFHLEPLDREETHSYILHRLQVAGGPGSRHTFDMEACDAVYRSTGGTPRLINMLCDVALVYGFAEQERTVNAELIYEVVLDKKGGGILPLREIAGPFEASETDRLICLHTPIEEQKDDDRDHAVNNSEDNRPDKSDTGEFIPPESISDHVSISQTFDEISAQTNGVENRRTLAALSQTMRLPLVFRRLLKKLPDKNAALYIEEIRRKCQPLLREIYIWAHYLWSRGKVWSIWLMHLLRKNAHVQSLRNSIRTILSKQSASEDSNYLQIFRVKCDQLYRSLTPSLSVYRNKIFIAVAAISILGLLAFLGKASLFRGHDEANVIAQDMEATPHALTFTNTTLRTEPSTPTEIDHEDQLSQPLDPISATPLASVADEKPQQITVTHTPTQDENMVIVREGRTLSTILVEKLGRYDAFLLDEVLRLNPDIRNPDDIKVGQIITLPNKL